MTQLNLQRFVIASLLYFTLCIAAQWVITPLSFINFVAPAAALVSGLILLWGTVAFAAVLITSPIVAWYFQQYLGMNLDLAAMLIALLAIILQGFWTKQLTYRFIVSKKWLKSRRWLLFFLLRLGPLASLVSATAVVVIAILDNKVMQGSLAHTFLTSWSTSMLVAVFFIPLILLNKDNKQLNTSKKMFVSITSVLGAIAISLLFKTSQIEQNHHRLDDFLQKRLTIERKINQEIADTVSLVNSLGALFNAKKHVSLAEFTLFSESILRGNTSVRALEWAPIVTLADKLSFEREASLVLNQPFTIKDRINDRLFASETKKAYYAPLYYIYPNKRNNMVLGLDVYTHTKETLSMEAVTYHDGILASAPLTLVQDDFTKPGVLFTAAVFSYDPIKIFAESEKLILKKVNKAENLRGFVMAVTQFNDLFLSLAEDGNGEIDFFIQDITGYEPYVLFGKAVTHDNRHVDSIIIEVFSRQWRVDIAEHTPWFAQSKSWQAWAVLIGGTFGAFLFQILILMMAAYSSELSQQVELKTRALILSKEKSDQKSLAKTNFLQTLNDELRIPLQFIKSFIDQLKQKGINNKQVTGIIHSGNNIGQLLDTMMDLSEIESGTLKIKSNAFDFYGFLNRMELMLKAKNEHSGKSIFFLINKEVPHFINGDELRIQKLLHVLTHSAQQLFSTDALRLTIKLHEHKFNRASLFFIYSHQDEATSSDSDDRIKSVINQGIASYSTSMAMVKEISQLLQGNINLGLLPSGGGVLSVSIRVQITTSEQQSAHQALFFDDQ